MSDERLWTERIWTAVWTATSGEVIEPTPEERAERCFRALEPRVYRTLVRNFPRVPPADVEDAVQFAFVQYWRALQNGREVTDPVSWLATVAKHDLLKRIRYASRWGSAGKGGELLQDLTQTLTDDTTVDDLLMRAFKHERYRPAVESLPAFERRCFMGRLANLTLKEIGAREGVDFRRVAEAIGRAVVHITRHVNGD